MTGVEASAIWPVGFRVRPSADGDSPAIEVTDTVEGRKFRWRPESLSSYVLASSDAGLTGDGDAWYRALSTASDRRHLVEQWRHWQARGWHPSDLFYVASRRWTYVDSDDPNGYVRRQVIERLIEEEGPPPSTPEFGTDDFELPAPDPPGRYDIAEVLVRRRTVRAFTATAVPVEVMAGVLWYGFSDVRRNRARTTPEHPISYVEQSSGSAWEVYMCVFDVAGLGPGVYRYDLSHAMTETLPGDHRKRMVSILQGMDAPRTAAWTLVLVADIPRWQWRYRHEHALRRLYMDCGVLGQDLIVLGTSYGLGTLVTPAQKDTELLDLLGLPMDRYAPMYTLTMGYTRRYSDLAGETEDEEVAHP